MWCVNQVFYIVNWVFIFLFSCKSRNDTPRSWNCEEHRGTNASCERSWHCNMDSWVGGLESSNWIYESFFAWKIRKIFYPPQRCLLWKDFYYFFFTVEDGGIKIMYATTERDMWARSMVPVRLINSVRSFDWLIEWMGLRTRLHE